MKNCVLAWLLPGAETLLNLARKHQQDGVRDLPAHATILYPAPLMRLHDLPSIAVHTHVTIQEVNLRKGDSIIINIPELADAASQIRSHLPTYQPYGGQWGVNPMPHL